MENTVCFNCFRDTQTSSGPCPHCGYDPSEARNYPLALPLGSILNGRYIIGRPLGQGGFGITYIAQDVQTNKRFAIKEYFPETMATRTQGHNVTPYSGQRQDHFTYGIQCFLSEAQTLAQFIGVESIVQVYSYFEENGTAYFVMDHVDGISFQTYLKQKGGKISWEEAKSILFPVMDALSIVHSKGIIHRDISPDNIYLPREGGVKLLDFGAARYSLGDRSRSLDVVLKAGYAPKEQYTRRGRQGPFTDVYSMAATLYFSITGRLPPESVDRDEEDELILPSSFGVRISPQEEDALEKGLAVRSMDRYQTMEDFRRALSADTGSTPAPVSAPAVHSHPVTAPTTSLSPPDSSSPPPRETPPPAAKKRKPAAFIAAGIGAVLALVLGLSLFTGRNPTPAAEASPQVPSAPSASSDPAPEAASTASTATGNKFFAIGYDFTAGLRSDGTVAVAGVNDIKVSTWTDITAIEAGTSHLVGLRSDGTVLAAGSTYNGLSDVSQWDDIIDISSGYSHTAGLRADGTVVAAGDNEHGQCLTQDWTDVVAIIAESNHTIGLRSDGTVLATGKNDDGQCNVSDWTDIVSVASDSFVTVGLRSDGTVVTTRDDEIGKYVNYWKDIVAIEASLSYPVGLRSDGTVVSLGTTGIEVSKWTQITALCSNSSIIMGLRADGTVAITGTVHAKDSTLELAQEHVSDWRDICALWTSNDVCIGMSRTGILYCIGDNAYGQCEITSWKDIKQPIPAEPIPFSPAASITNSLEDFIRHLTSETITNPPDYSMKPVSLRTKVTTYDDNEEITSEGFYTYDSQGNEIASEFRHPAGSTIKDYSYKSEYGPCGNLLRKTRYENGAATGAVDQYFYNADGRKTAAVIIYSTGTTNVTVYEYDAQGNQVLWQSLDDHAQMKYGGRYQYDEKGKLVKFESLAADGSVREWTQYEYDADGNEVKATTYQDGSVHSVYERTFDTHGNKLSQTSYSDGKVSSQDYYTYNEHNDLISISSETSRYEYRYTYDSDGNKRTEECLRNGKLMRTAEYTVQTIPVWED